MDVSVQADRARDYYDEFAGGQLAGYLYGNPRVAAALRFVCAWTPETTLTLVDVGCGIGESTATLKRRCPRATVLGVDISPKSIDIARRLFGDSGAVFETLDIARDDLPIEPPVDIIVMIDVFEHIAAGQRSAAAAALNRLLSPAGRILLTLPSVAYQRFLRRERPREVQPVDEEVTRGDLERLAAAVAGTLAHFEPVTIWQADDYVHAAIVRGAANPVRVRARRRSSVTERSRTIEARLDVRVTPEGLQLPLRSGPRVCVIQPNRCTYSERLIHDHLQRLPADVIMLCDGWYPHPRPAPFPERVWNGERLLPRSARAVRRAGDAMIPGAAFVGRRIETSVLTRYLRQERIHVVLGEYGPIGVGVMAACERARVPLVVHFHGYDAHHRATIEKHSEGYRRLFAVAAAIVVVSPTMHAALIALGAPPAKVRLNFPGVDTRQFADANPATSAPTFVAAGRFVPKKAPHVTLSAFASVLKSRPDARLVMCGEGVLLESSRALAQSLQLGDRVEFRGVCNHGEIAGLFRTARAFVQHSVHADDGESEGLPVSLLEAASAGLPIVSTQHAGIPEAVVDGKTGFLVREHDVDAMAARMLDLAQHPDLAGRLGAGGRQLVLEGFSIERSIDGLWSILAESIRR